MPDKTAIPLGYNNGCVRKKRDLPISKALARWPKKEPGANVFAAIAYIIESGYRS